MIGRITTMMIASTTLDELDQAYNSMSNTQEELSSGKTINQPSDNPYGMSVVLDMQGQLGALTSYSNNVTDGNAWAQAGQTALTDISNVVQRVRELVVAAANGTNTAADTQADAAEVSQLIDEVKQDANTTYDGQYIFSGTSNTAPYTQATGDVYQGNSGPGAAVNRLIGPNTTVQVNVDLSSVLGNGQSGPGGPDGKLLDTLRSIYSDMMSGNTTALGQTDLTNLDTNMNALTELQTSLGATTDRLQLASTTIGNMQVADTQVLSNTQDTDMAQAEINFSTEQAAYEAALKAGANIVQESLMNFLSN